MEDLEKKLGIEIAKMFGKGAIGLLLAGISYNLDQKDLIPTYAGYLGYGLGVVLATASGFYARRNIEQIRSEYTTVDQ